MTVKKLQNAYYVVQDMERARTFYRDVLGLDPAFEDEAKWTQYKAGGVNFALSSTGEAASGATGATVVFEVDDIAAARAAIAAGGGVVEHERDMGDHGKALTFRDTEGNLLQLFQRAG